MDFLHDLDWFVSTRIPALTSLAGIIAFIALQKILKILGTQLNTAPLVWDSAKGLISGVFIALPMSWILAKLRFASIRK